LNDQLASLPVCTAVDARISCTSRQPRPGFASSMSAATPLTSGEENEVPLRLV
jgi:hypothetical protein